MENTMSEKLYQELLDNDLFLQWVLHPTDETNEYWNTIMQQDPDKKEAVQKLKTIIHNLKIVEEPLIEDTKNKLWQDIESAINKKQNKKTKLIKLSRYAAAVLILLITTFSIYIIHIKPDKSSPVMDIGDLATTQTIEQTESENVIILLANHEKVEIEDENAELIYDADGKINVNSKSIQNQDISNSSSTSFNQLLVPYGKTSSIILSDGTKIWVNSGSRVIYPPVFADQKREIYIEGEVFLDVTHNKNVPFIVKTDKLEVCVLGTSFNVSAYKNDDAQSIVLATGSVSINEINKTNTTIIKPNQKFTYENSTAISYTEKVDILNYISWKYGFLQFEKENLNSILKKIERYYNIPLAYQSKELNHITLSGKLDLKENIEETFRIISITAPIKYQIGKDEIKIDVKP